MSSETKDYIAVLKALYDYEPSAEDELGVKEDQLLFLLEKTDDEWWKVKHKPESQEDETAPSGLVPASYLEEAEPTSVVKVLYDYEAVSPGELSVKEDEILSVYGKDDEWLLVKSERDGGKVGYIPGNYVEESTGENETIENQASNIVIPDSPPLRPTSTYVDPADRVVAATVGGAKAEHIQTWSVSEVDKKGKKKKGTLGIGNGAIFFASESDKTPVQKWQTSDVGLIKLEKSKHVHLEIGGPAAASLHFNVGSKDTADAVVKKLESSRALATGSSSSPPAQRTSPPPATPPPISITTSNISPKPNKNGASVHFAASPALIPPPDTPIDDDPEEEDVGGETGSALYDFVADGEDEISVKEGETLIILDKVSSEEWWKCRNSQGMEGVVPASYIETTRGAALSNTEQEEGEGDEADNHEEQERIAREAAEREAAQRVAAEAEAAAAQARARAEKERKKQEVDRKAKAEAAAAKAEKEDREREKKERERREREERAAQERAAAQATRQSRPDKRTSQEDSRRTSTHRPSSSDQLKFPNEGKTRRWYDHSGQWHTEAEFLGISKGKIRLHKINGVVIEVPPEKMSPNDVRYIESMTGKKLNIPSLATPSRSRSKDDDDVPLGSLAQRKPIQEPAPSRPPLPSKKAPTIDWFEFFLNAGCDIDDCTRYAASFERDNIDEVILPDIKESTLRSLGLREGDIIRVTKAIEQRKVKPGAGRDDGGIKAQLERDEELARALQAEEEDGGTSSRRANTTSPPNLFSGPGGALKSQPRRGRPQPRGSAPPVNVDVNSIASASEQISRSASPLVSSPSVLRASSPVVNPPKRAPSTQPGGFDDDAWTNRPSSTKPTAPVTASVTSPAPPPAPAPPPPPPAPPAPPVPTPPAVTVTATQLQPAAPANSAQPTQPAQPAQNGQFELLAKIGQMRPPSAPVSQTSFVGRTSPVITSAPPQSFQAGLGMGSSPIPLGQHLQNQQNGLYQLPQNGPRGPLAPVPSNQSLLNPLIPTTTGFNQFVPTRPASNPPFQTSPFQPSAQSSFQPPVQPSFLSTPPTGYGSNTPMLPQQTGFPGMAPSQQSFPGIMTQPTGFSSGFSGPGMPNFMPPNGFGGVQSNPTGFSSAISQPMFNNGGLAPPSAVSPPKDHSPANVFAQMKSGTFGNDSAPQSADKYDALRPQPTGWQNGFQSQGSYSGY